MLQDDNDNTQEKGHKDISRVQTGLENQLGDQSKMPPGSQRAMGLTLYVQAAKQLGTEAN